MHDTKLTADRLAAFSDAVFAVIVTIMVLELRAPLRAVLAGADAAQVSDRARRLAMRRSLTVLGIFATAMLVAFFAPRIAFALICAALLLHLRPEAPGTRP
jgi:uncharacterized membrane protein